MMQTNYFTGIGPPNFGGLNLERVQLFVILACKENSENKIARLIKLYQNSDNKLNAKVIRKVLVIIF